MFAFKPWTVTIIRSLLIAAILFNAVVPTAALAKAGQPADTKSAGDSGLNSPRSVPEQKPLYFDPPSIPQSRRTSPEPDKPKSPVPVKDQVEFKLIAEPAIIPANGLVKFTVSVRNNSEQRLTGLAFIDQLEAGLDYSPDSASPIFYDTNTKEVTRNIESLASGEEILFSYSLIVTPTKKNEINGKIWLHNAELNSSESHLSLKTSTAIGVGLPMAEAQSEFAAFQPNGGWNAMKRVNVYMEKENAGKNALVILSPTKITGKGPDLQFNLDVFETSTYVTDALGGLNEQTLSLKEKSKSLFKKPVYLEINLNDYVDLQNIPAGQEPYVVTYDETYKIWVKVPILEQNIESNTVTVAATHFSTGVRELVARCRRMGRMFCYSINLIRHCLQVRLAIVFPFGHPLGVQGCNRMCPSHIRAGRWMAYWVMCRPPGWGLGGISMLLRSCERSPPMKTDMAIVMSSH